MNQEEAFTFLSPGQQVTKIYQYFDGEGNLAYEKLRIEPGTEGRKKDFKIRRPTANGYVWGLDREQPRYLYNLQQVEEAAEVWATEGEKDADTAIAIGAVATTNTNGGNEKWIEDDGTRPPWTFPLAGKTVYAWCDNDDTGRKRAEHVKQALNGFASAVYVVFPPEQYKDLTEWIEAGATPEQINTALEIASQPDASAIKQVQKLIRRRGEPAAEESEKLILGSIMNGSTPFQEVAALITANDFYPGNHKLIFRTIEELNGKGEPYDLKGVLGALHDHQQIEIAGGVSYLTDLTQDLPSAYNIDSHIEKVLKKAQSRRYVEAVMRSIEGLVAGGDLDATREGIAKATEVATFIGKTDEGATPSEIMSSVADFFGKRKPGIMCEKLPTLNRMTYGYQEGQLVIFGGRPSSGKSSLLGETAAFAARDGHNVDIITLEIGKEECLLKMVCQMAKVSYLDVIAGDVPDDKMALLQSIAQQFMQLPIRIYDSTDWTILKVRNHLRRQQILGRPVRLLGIDYLQLFPGSAPRRDLELGQITRGLKLLAKEFGLTIILLSQLSRDGEKLGREPLLSDLKDSGCTEADADIVVIVTKAKLYVLKVRNGATGSIPVDFEAEYTFFREAA